MQRLTLRESARTIARMTRTFAYAGKWVLAAAVAGFLIFGWVSLSRGPAAARGKTVIRVWDWWNPAGNAKLGRLLRQGQGRLRARAHPDIEIRYQFIPLGPAVHPEAHVRIRRRQSPGRLPVLHHLGDGPLRPRRHPRPRMTSSRSRRTSGRSGSIRCARHTRAERGTSSAYRPRWTRTRSSSTRRMARDAGLDPSPYAIESWDKFREYAEKLTVRDDTSARSPARGSS